MILLVDSNVAYLVIPKVKSRVVGYFQLSDYSKLIPYLTLNSAILVECKALCYIVSSVVETETAGIKARAKSKQSPEAHRV